jgi:uridylate kinase
MGNGNYGISSDVLARYSSDIASIYDMGVQVAIVVGGGNIFRGISGTSKGFDRVKGDNMGMLATVINSIAIQSALEKAGLRAKVLTSVCMEPVGEHYSTSKAIEYLEVGNIVIVAGGTGNPFFTTDSAAALRGIELNANVLLKGTRVDGVYTADPEKYPDATKYESLSFDEAYSKGLKIMDLTAFTLCRENALPIHVFDMNTAGNLKKVVMGENTGTIIK